MSNLSKYCGWTITYSSTRPETGKFIGERFGVTVCAGTLELLYKIIDYRIKEYPPSGA